MNSRRKVGERIVVVVNGELVTFTILQICDEDVRIQVEAPDTAAIYRGEILDMYVQPEPAESRPEEAR